MKQAGAELCQAQVKLGLVKLSLPTVIIMLSKFHCNLQLPAGTELGNESIDNDMIRS